MAVENNDSKKGWNMNVVVGPGEHIDVKTVKEQAEAEVREERIKAAKEKVKRKLKEIDTAELVLRNLKRELDDIYAELSQ